MGRKREREIKLVLWNVLWTLTHVLVFFCFVFHLFVCCLVSVVGGYYYRIVEMVWIPFHCLFGRAPHFTMIHDTHTPTRDCDNDTLLVCFVLLHTITLGSIWVIHMKCSLHSYIRQTWVTYWTASLQQNALSFTLFWTLFYGLVYLY